MVTDVAGADHRQVLLLGMLMEQPTYGQQLREIITEHHDLFPSVLKKPTMYYQLERLVAEGCLELQTETVDAPGHGRGNAAIAPRERDVYRVTEVGRERFFRLLRGSLAAYSPSLSAVDVSIFFLHHLSSSEAIELLEGRRHRITEVRQRLLARRAAQGEDQRRAHRIVDDHTLSLLDAEAAWIGRTIARLRSPTIGSEATEMGGH